MAGDARGIIIRKSVKPQVGELVDIDCCLEESHSFTNQITDHPVESGSNISDHSRPEPDRVTLRCFVSNTPLSEGQTKSAIRQGSLSWETTAPEYVDGRGKNALEQLEKMRQGGALVNVVTSLKTYAVKDNEGMMIESINIPVTAENYDGLEFTISLKKVIVVKTRTTRVTADRRARAPKKKGQVAKKEEKPKDNRTGIAHILDGESPI